jgi:threonine/homoserine/homoserine lactone efflux protein
MNSTTPALIAAAAGVGLGHAIMPDHWVPLAVVGATRRYPVARLARLSGLAGLAHVLVSLLLGGLIVAVGLQFRSTVEHAQNAIVGGVLLATGVAFVALELSGHGHSHAHDEHAHGHSDGAGADGHGRHTSQLRGHIPVAADGSTRTRAIAGITVPFGAAASPDLTILPVFLAATTVGAGTAVGSLIAFAAVTICTIVGLTLLAAAGGYRIRGQWLERWTNSITAGVLIVIGTLVLAGAI